MNYQQIFDSLAPLYGFVSDNLAYVAREAVRVTSGLHRFQWSGTIASCCPSPTAVFFIFGFMPMMRLAMFVHLYFLSLLGTGTENISLIFCGRFSWDTILKMESNVSYPSSPHVSSHSLAICCIWPLFSFRLRINSEHASPRYALPVV